MPNKKNLQELHDRFNDAESAATSAYAAALDEIFKKLGVNSIDLYPLRGICDYPSDAFYDMGITLYDKHGVFETGLLNAVVKTKTGIVLNCTGTESDVDQSLRFDACDEYAQFAITTFVLDVIDAALDGLVEDDEHFFIVKRGEEADVFYRIGDADEEGPAFEYQGFHFVPKCQFGDLGLKTDLKTFSEHTRSCRILGLNTYDKSAHWSHKEFYAASGGSVKDVFYCLETGLYYSPGENELFEFEYPSLD